MRYQLLPQTKERVATSPIRTHSLGLQRQCTCGGTAGMSGTCEECSRSRLSGLQTKLAVSQPGDPHEQEADRIAGEVMRMSDPRSSIPHSDYPEAPSISRKPTGQSAGWAGESLVNSVISSPGQPLDSKTRAFFEPRFGHHFGEVRVHADQAAAESAASVGARAYTVGEHVVFGPQQFAPGSMAGRRLLAHELTHVIQQGRAADHTIVPEDSEEEESAAQTPAASSAEAGVEQISPQITQRLSSGSMLQRADCPCCADSISIDSISRIDTPTRMGHNFNVNFGLTYPASGPSGSCTLEWWEKTNVPYVAGMDPNKWTNMFALVPTSSTFAPWVKRPETCGSSSPITITDIPSLGRTAGRTVARTLEFRIVVNSGPPRSDSGCPSASQQVTATQVLTMTGGAPDWSASSFTTP